MPFFALGRDTTVCTIYEGNFDPPFAELARVALAFFNDVILRAAFERRIGVIDLRLVCTEPSDYANPIEPSGSGGAKIASAILKSYGPESLTSRPDAASYTLNRRAGSSSTPSFPPATLCPL
jgi:hypothetical protein